FGPRSSSTLSPDIMLAGWWRIALMLPFPEPVPKNPDFNLSHTPVLRAYAHVHLIPLRVEHCTVLVLQFAESTRPLSPLHGWGHPKSTLFLVNALVKQMSNRQNRTGRRSNRRRTDVSVL